MIAIRLAFRALKQKFCRHDDRQDEFSPIAQCVKCGRVRYAGYRKEFLVREAVSE